MKMIRLNLSMAFFMLIGASSVQAHDLWSNYNTMHTLSSLINSAKAAPRPVENAQAQTVGQGGQNSGQCAASYPMGEPIVVSVERDRIQRRSFYLCRTGYAVQFDPATKTPLWSAETLTANQVSAAHEPRTNDFQPDPQVPYAAQATLNDYKHTSFDRGHMSPAADQAGRPDPAMSQSFYLTNMVPQVGFNQNRGIWADLEAQVRQWTEQRGELLVVTGPIFDQSHATMGRSGVWVPTRLYKVILDPRTMESIAFVIPNQQIVTSKTHSLDNGNPEFPQTQASAAINCNNVCSLANFVVPVAQVSQLTGLRFFSRLNDVQYNEVTQNIGKSWRLR